LSRVEAAARPRGYHTATWMLASVDDAALQLQRVAGRLARIIHERAAFVTSPTSAVFSA
jgi:hypothetical protein